MRMRCSFFLYICLPVACYAAVNNIKSLTESLGQEVIEMDAPIKELPPEIEEEPSAEMDADIKPASTMPPSSKSSTIKETRRKMKEASRSFQEDEEARIEKELSELYKDSSDYKADSAEAVKLSGRTSQPTTREAKSSIEVQTGTEVQSGTEEESGAEDGALKLVARARDDFRFQPDTNNKADVERFRTSVDVISCDRNRLTGATVGPLSSGHKLTSSAMMLATFTMRNVMYF